MSKQSIPYDIEMEQHALGAMLRGGSEGAGYYSHHAPDLFHDGKNHTVAWGIKRLVDRGAEVNYLTVLAELDTSGNRDAAGGLDYLSHLEAKVISAANNPLLVLHHLDDYRLRRFAISLRSREPLSSGMDEYNQLLAEITGAQRFITPAAVCAADAVHDALLEIEEGTGNEVKVGLQAFDALVGARKGDMMIVGAKTSVGKTNIGINFARGVVERGKSAIIHSFEMAAPLLIKRIFAHYSGIENWKVQRGKLNISERDKITDSASHLMKRGLWIRDQDATWPQHLAAYESIIRADPNVELLVIDYVGLVRGIPGDDARYMQLGTVSRDLKNLARRLGVLVVALSQFNRKIQGDDKPCLENLRESGDLEQNTDIAVLVSAPDAQENKTLGRTGPEKLVLDIAKNRNGNVGEIDVMYDRRFCNPPEAPIWMADFTFKSLGEVVEGDEIIGWRGDGIGRKSRWKTVSREHKVLCKATVLKVLSRDDVEVVKVTLESGSVIRCTANHLWLSGGKSGYAESNFFPASVNKKLCRVIGIPERLTCSEENIAGWLGGMFDGEGSWPRIAQSRKANREVYDVMCERLTKLGFKFVEKHDQVSIHGGRQAAVNFINWCNPVKFNISKWSMERAILRSKFRTGDKIIKVEADGRSEVISLQTTTGNYVAWGYASKNCRIVDWPAEPSNDRDDSPFTGDLPPEDPEEVQTGLF